MNDHNARKAEYFECCSHDCRQGRDCKRLPEGGTVLTLAFVSILALLVGLVIALVKQFGGV